MQPRPWADSARRVDHGWRYSAFSVATPVIGAAGIRFRPAEEGSKQEMDRRTITAFLLMAALLVLYQVIFPEPKRSAPPARTTTPDTISGPPEASTRAVAPPPEWTGERPAVPEAEPGTKFGNLLIPPDSSQAPVLLESPFLKAILNPDGAVFTTWTLQQFTDARELPADLVRRPAIGILRPRLEIDGRTIDLSETLFQVETAEEDGRSVTVLRARDPGGAEVTLEYRYPGRNEYTVDLRVLVDGLDSHRRDAFLVLAIPDGVQHLEKDPKMDRVGSAGVGQVGSRVVKHALEGGGFGCAGGGGARAWRESVSGVIHWVGVRTKYFLAALVVKTAPDGELVLARPEGSAEISAEVRLPLHLDGQTSYDFEFYAGPMQLGVLQEFGVGLEKSMDLGWKIIQPFTRLLFWFFQAVHRVVPNYGLVIIVLSVLVKVIFYPLTRKSMESMRQLQVLKPEMDRISAKYKDDPTKRNQAVMELYKKNKVNPLGGCLPILVQMPVFIALYSVLNVSVELRKAPFALWITDLSMPDRVGAIMGLPINILPLVMAGTMFWQQKLTPTDPRQAAMAYMMPIIMTIFFYSMPSGLVLYWTVTNVMAVAQQILINRGTKKQLAAA